MDFVFTVCDNAAGLPDLAGPADDGTLGDRRPGGRRGDGHRAGSGVRRGRLATSKTELPWFTSLPIESIDRLSLGTKLRDIGRVAWLDLRPGEGKLMTEFDLSRRLAAEALGTGLLVATVVGSGIMAESLTRMSPLRSSAIPCRPVLSWSC